MNVRRRFQVCLTGLFIGLYLLTLTTTYSLAQTSSLITIEGQVFEDLTGSPLENATITAFTKGGLYKSVTEADSNGNFKIVTEGGGKCRVYAYYDNLITPGFDYAPAFQSFDLPEGAITNLTFRLTPAASVMLEGEILFVEDVKPPFSIDFVLINPTSGLPLNDSNRVYIYGNSPNSHSGYIGLNPQHVVIPTDRPLNIRVNSTILVEQTAFSIIVPSFTFIIDGTELLNLSKGQLFQVDVRKYSLSFNLELVRERRGAVSDDLDKRGLEGFYVTAERKDLTTIDELIEKAEADLTQGDFDECYANLREAYVNVLNLESRLGTMYAEASTSAIILIFFLAFTATILAYLVIERGVQKAVATGICYTILLMLLYVTFPGCRILDTVLFFGTATISLGGAVVFAFIFPSLLKEKAVEGQIAFRSMISAVFSLAKRNLKRRRLRFLLTLSTVTIMVMSFVVLTSFSRSYGLVAETLATASYSSEGLLVMNPLPSFPSPIIDNSNLFLPTFTPLLASEINWIEEKPETVLVAPKAENVPALHPIGSYTSLRNGESKGFFGVLGILPSAEVLVTGIDRTIVDGGGRYLYDQDEYAVLISAEAAATLNAEIGDMFLIRIEELSIMVELVGVFDEDLFNELVDLDGAPLIPNKVYEIFSSRDAPPIYDVAPCDPSEIIVTTWQTALRLSSKRVFLSRIDTQTQDSQSILPLARRLALERDCWVWAVKDGQIFFTALTAYVEAKGFPVLIPYAIVILTVVTTMLNSIFERRREISILSSIGLNPSHITGLFVAEAIIIGVVGGGVGYLSGLGVYRFMAAIITTLEIRQKISVAWCLGALSMSATAVVIGAVVSLRSSVSLTPSLLRRWRVKEKQHKGQPWVFTLPIEIKQNNITSFMDYVRSHLEEYTGEGDIRVGRIHQSTEETPQSTIRRIRFTHSRRGGVGGFFTVNELVAKKDREDEEYKVKLISKGTEDWTYKTATFIRRLVLRWSTTSE